MTVTHREVADRLRRIEHKLDVVLRDYGLDTSVLLDAMTRERDMWKAQAQAAVGFAPKEKADTPRDAGFTLRTETGRFCPIPV